MTPEQQVPTLETCKALKEAGWVGDTYFVYLIDVETNVFNSLQGLYAVHHANKILEEDGDIVQAISAPTLQELLKELVILGNEKYRNFSIETGGRMYWEVSISDWDTPQWYCNVGGSINIPENDIEIFHNNPAEAAALLWLELRKEDKR